MHRSVWLLSAIAGTISLGFGSSISVGGVLMQSQSNTGDTAGQNTTLSQSPQSGTGTQSPGGQPAPIAPVPGTLNPPRLGALPPRRIHRTEPSVSPTRGPAPLKVTARAQRGGPPYSQMIMQTQWDFGDGTVVSGKNEFMAKHTYTQPGKYAVRFCPLTLSMHGDASKGCPERSKIIATVTVTETQD